MDREEVIQRVSDRYGADIEELLEVIQVGIELVADAFYVEIEAHIEELDIL